MSPVAKVGPFIKVTTPEAFSATCLVSMGGNGERQCLLPIDHEGAHMHPIGGKTLSKILGKCAASSPTHRGVLCCRDEGHRGDHGGLAVGSEWSASAIPGKAPRAERDTEL